MGCGGCFPASADLLPPANHKKKIASPCWTKTRKPSSKRSEEHTSELQSLMRISYAVFCLKKKTTKINQARKLQQTISQYHYRINKIQKPKNTRTDTETIKTIKPITTILHLTT